MKTISLGVPELDKGLGGGIPHPSLISIEGEHGSGKTVISQQIVYHMLKSGIKSIVITTENTVKEYLKMMKSIKLDATSFFITGRLKIYSFHVKGGMWSKYLSPLFLHAISSFLAFKNTSYKCIVIDDLSSLSIDVTRDSFLTFITRMKNLVSDGRTIILTFHPKFLEDESIRILKASSDVYFVMKNAYIGNMQVKVLQIVKLWGSFGERKAAINLEINPSLGLRVLPIGEVSI